MKAVGPIFYIAVIGSKPKKGGSAIYFYITVINTIVDTLCATTSHDFRRRWEVLGSSSNDSGASTLHGTLCDKQLQ